MTRINQRHGTPRMPGGKRFPLSRGAFLEGRAKVYYGPGQTANAAPELGLDYNAYLGGTTEVQDYKNPEDWPAAGRLLRVPQVVYLSSLYPGSNDLEQTDDLVMYSGGGNFPSPDVNNGEGRVVFYIYSLAVPNQYRDESVRLKAVFADAKDAIEGLRPGVTFIEIQNWQGPNGTQAKNFTASRYSHMLAPPPTEEVYFGTNFLHVYAGHFAYDSAATHAHRGMFYDDDDTALTDPVYLTSKDRVLAAYPRFAGYATALFGPVFDWSGAATCPITLSSISKSQGSTLTPADRANALVKAAAKQPQGAAAIWQKRDDLNVKMLQATATDLADYGFAYHGPTTDITADSLVNMIADHYGFDPETGKDLG